MSAFERLHPALQRHLWDLGWAALRPIQTRMVAHVLDGRGDALVTAPTAAGKTEAAFLPILSVIADAPGPGFRAIYVGAVKALINDQFRRLEDLCARLHVPVHRWHGDVDQTARRDATVRPGGVLLITPESLEAMFVVRPAQMPGMFETLQFVVIDELHAFIGTERGAQLRSVLHRIDHRCGCRPVRIGLSATIADPEAACRWLRPVGVPGCHIEDPAATRRVSLRIGGYWLDPPSQSRPGDDEDGEDAGVMTEIARDAVDLVEGRTSLAFANTKACIEVFADEVQSALAARGRSHEVVVHHGSLSKTVRESAEARIARGRCLAVCSNTLELGIDIGVVDQVLQITAPPSVASLAQRLGRSGRREHPAQLRGFLIARRPTEGSSWWEPLQLDFLRGVASVQLLLERFVEPAAHGRAHGSTLVQQILSALAASGGMPAMALYDLLGAAAGFGSLTPADFADLLRSLGHHGLIEQIPGNDLVLGPRGERIVGHYAFFAAFKAEREVPVRDLGRGVQIGMLPFGLVPPVGEYVLLAGRRWEIVEIDRDRAMVGVRASDGRRAPLFRGAGWDVHPRVHRQMLALASGTEVPPYLDARAREILAAIRREAAALGGLRRPFVDLGSAAGLWLWSGTKISRTLTLCLRLRGVEVRSFDVGLQAELAPSELARELAAIVSGPPDPCALAREADASLGARLVHGEKFDEFLPLSSWQRAYASDHLDLPGTLETIGAALGDAAEQRHVAGPAPGSPMSRVARR